MNNFNAIGRICNDLVLKETKNGKKYLRFDLAISRNYKNKDGEKETDFISCTAFNNLASIVNDNAAKGDKIGIIGQLKTNNYVTTEGSKVRGTNVLLEKIDLISNKRNVEGSLTSDQAEDIDEEILEDVFNDEEIL